jgi:hypothetical protein
VKQAMLLISMFLVSNIFGQEVRQAQLSGRQVELKLVKADDLSPVAWPEEHIELRHSSATTSADKNIYMMLQANGIAPDSQAFAVMYDLNPSVSDLNSLASKTSIQLPEVIGGPQFKNLLQGGDLVQLTLDPDIRKQLNQSIESLQSFVPSINQLSSQPEAQSQLTSLLQWYADIEKRFRRRTDPPLRQATLVQMLDEAKVLQSILEGARQQRREVTSDEQHQISAIYDDLKVEMTHYGQTLAGLAPTAQPYCVVTVNVKGGDPGRIPELRVYYTYNGLFRPLPAQPPVASFGFSRLGSGQSENLLPKNYQIWAARDGDPNHPLTPPYLLRIGDTSAGPLSVDLSLTGGGRQ